MLRRTVNRIGVPPERTLVVTVEGLQDLVAAELPELPAENILIEPTAKGTAVSIGWAAFAICRRGGGTMSVFPSDHHIGDLAAWETTLALARREVASGAMILLGQRPTSPHTGYGYIRVMGDAKGGSVPVVGFVEKPDRTRAESLLIDGAWWNGGMVVAAAETARAAVLQHLPSTGAALQAWADGAAIKTVWEDVDIASFDRAVLEKEPNLQMIGCDFGWSDIGGFSAFSEQFPEIAGGRGEVSASFAVNAERNVVVAPGFRVALVDVSDLQVVIADDVVYVGRDQTPGWRDKLPKDWR